MLIRIIFLTLLSLVLSAHAAAASRVVRVGIYENAPKVHFDDQGQAEGILVDLLHEVARAERWELRFVRCAWVECLDALGKGELDLLPDVAWTAERERVLDFHRIPALFSWSQIYRRSDVALTAMSDIGSKRVAVLSGSIQERYFTDFAKDFGVAPRIIRVDSITDAFDLVARGEADAVVASKFVDPTYTSGRNIVETPIMFLPARLFFASGQGRNPDLLAALDRKLGPWQADPHSVYFEILERWRSRGLVAQVPAWVWWGAALTVALLGLAMALAAWLKRQVIRKSGALKESEHRLETVLDSVDSLIYIKDADFRYTYANRALHAFLGHGGGNIIGRQDSELFPPPVAAEIRRNDARTMGERRRVVSEETVPDAGGRQVTVLSTKIPLCREDGSVYGLCGVSIDISERRAAEESNRVAATVFQSAEGMFIATPDRRLLRANDAFCAMSGCTVEELSVAGLPPFSLSPEGEDASDMMWAAVEQLGKWQGEIWTRRSNGEPYPARLTVTAVRDDGGRLTHFVGTQGDITAQKLAQDEIARLAYFDSLTGLPNRRMLLERLRHSLPLHDRAGQVAALLFLDLDNFKDLNDLRGHETGNRLLQQVAGRIGACTRAGDTVARLGGDEFVVLLENVGRDEQEAMRHVAATGWKIIVAMREPFDIDGLMHHATCSLGAALRTDPGIDIDSLMKRGDMAMYGAKRDGRDTLCFFHPDMEARVTGRLAMEAELRDALATSRFALHYQPQVDSSGRISGAEALLRWNSPARGSVSPAEFIPVAEASGLIVPIGNWALRSACAQLAQWSRLPHMAAITVAVNVSVHQVHQPGFVGDVLQIVEGCGIDPARLKLELTESVLIEDVEDTIGKMERLRTAGVRFALDDFGTGYSSLSYLKRLPLDQLKIDRSFVRDILTNPNDVSIARSIVALSEALGLGIIAEGVETAEQRAFLAEIGCTCCQGYLLGRPMEASAFEQLVRAQAA